MKPGLVSVIIPTFNRRAHVIDAAVSAIGQSYGNVEVIVVDDGSTDETADLFAVDKNGNLDSRLRYIFQENAGASAARNIGLQHANGEFIQFLDSDDVLCAEKLEKQIDVLRRNKTMDFCYCYGVVSTPSMAGETDFRIGRQHASRQRLMASLVGKEPHVMQTSAPLWRSEFISENHGWNESLSLGDDLEYHVRLVLAATDFGFVNHALFVMQRHGGEHLGDMARDQNKVQSAIHTQKCIGKALLNGDGLERPVFKSFAKKSLSSYVGFLMVADRENLLSYESWCRQYWPRQGVGGTILALIAVRKMIGREAMLKFLKTVLALRGIVRRGRGSHLTRTEE